MSEHPRRQGADDVNLAHLRRIVEARLCRWPRGYATALRLFRRGNPERSLYLSLLRQGDTTFDVGANFGTYTVLFANICGPEGGVHAFEPVPGSFEVLRQQVREYCLFDNVTCNLLAVSDRSGDACLHVPGGDLGQASLRTHQEGSWLGGLVEAAAVDAHSITLDEYTRSWESGPQFVKIDVEGAELLVLRGASSMLRTWRPILHLEVFGGWTRAFGYQPRDLLRFLLEHGYDEFFVSSDKVTRLTDPWLQIQSLGESANILCAIGHLHADRLARVLGHAPQTAASPINGPR